MEGEGLDRSPQEQRRTFGGFARPLTVVMLILATVAATTYMLARGATDNGRREGTNAVPLPTPSSITRNAVTFHIALTSPVGATLDSSDPRALTVYAFDIEQPKRPECSAIDPQVRVVSETAEAVRIATFDYSAPAPGATESTVCDVLSASGDASSIYKALKVPLDDALGARRLIDEKSGKEIGVLDRHYAPTPAFVPPGYEQTFLTHYTPKGDFIALSQYENRGRGSSLTISLRSQTAWTQLGKVTGHAQVADADATIAEHDDQRCVSWSPRGGLVAEVCSDLDTFLTPEELLRIANSLPPIE